MLGVGALPGYEIAFGGHSRRWQGPVATLRAAPSHAVAGVVYDMDAADLTALDAFEGYPRVYTRDQLTVELLGGGALQAHVYIHATSTGVGRPSPSYLEVIRLAYLRHGFDSAPLAVAANPGTDTQIIHTGTLLFVYGTLLLGEENHSAIRDARWHGPARTHARYRMCDLGEYPALVEGGDCSVVGELYEVDEATLTVVDCLEGHPRFYRRQTVELLGGAVAQTYMLAARKRGGLSPVEDGDWRSHRRRSAKSAGTGTGWTVKTGK